MSTNKAKYRPVLTASQIQHILKLAKSEQPISEASIEVISKLAPFAAKIESNAVQAAYSIKPAKETSLLADLGESPSETISAEATSNEIAQEHYNKEEYWEQCYLRYKDNPASCSLREIEAAQEHMYLNELMTAEEIAAFEAKQLTSF